MLHRAVGGHKTPVGAGIRIDMNVQAADKNISGTLDASKIDRHCHITMPPSSFRLVDLPTATILEAPKTAASVDIFGVKLLSCIIELQPCLSK